MTTSDILVNLLRQCLWHEQCNIPETVDWNEIHHLADVNGISAIIGNGLGNEVELPSTYRLQWVSSILAYEKYYNIQTAAMTHLAHIYAENGIKMMILKGIGLSMNYPVPSHRPSGDLDIWCFGDWEKSNDIIKRMGIKIDNSHHTHSVFKIDGVTVENHYHFVSEFQRFSNRLVNIKLEDLAKKDVVEKDGVYYPSADFNALHILRHCAGDFSSTQMTLRQVLDWGFFMQKHHGEICWDNYLPFIIELGMGRFFNLMNLVCVRNLGFPSDCFHNLEDDAMEEMFLSAIINPEIGIKEDGSLWSGLVRKPERWWRNRWKRKLCYSDNDLVTFIYGLWGKILKPSHFLH